MKKAEDYKAWQTAEEFMNYVKKHSGKLTNIDKYKIKQMINDAVRLCDADLVRVMRNYIENH